MGRLNLLDAIGDQAVLLIARVTVRFLAAGALAARRAQAAALIGRYEGAAGDGMRFERRFLAVCDREIRRRAALADFWGSM